MRHLVGGILAAILVGVTGCSMGSDDLAMYMPEPAPRDTRAVCGTGPTDLDVTAGRSTPVADPAYPDRGNAALDVLAYQLGLTWAPSTGDLGGIAVLTIRAAEPVDHLSLDFSRMYTVDRLFADGLEMSWAFDGDHLVVPTRLDADGETVLTLCYHGRPKLSPGAGLQVNGDGTLAAVSAPTGASTWFPVNELASDKAVYRTSLSVPSGWSGVAHGELLGVDSWGGTATFTWQSREPVAPAATLLAAGPYRSVTDEVNGTTLTYWLRPGRDDAYEDAVRRTPEVLAWLAERFGPYPFPSAGAVFVDSTGPAATQQTAALVPGDDVAGQLVYALAGEWFGAAVTPADQASTWIAEGLAGYARALWAAEQGITDPPLTQPARIMRALHQAVGDSAFFALARDWAQEKRNAAVDRAEFASFVAARTGRDITALAA